MFADDKLAEQQFREYASVDEKTGERYLSVPDFVEAVTPPDENYEKISRESYAVLYQVADQNGTGRVSFDEWMHFIKLLEQPDAEFQIAFRVFAPRGQDSVSFQQFLDIYNQNKSEDSYPFDWNGNWASLYTGQPRRRHSMTYHQFSQMLSGVNGERVRQAFRYYDKKNTGFITAEQFQEMITRISGHKLSTQLVNSLHTVIDRPNSSSAPWVSYPTVRAFNNIVRNSEMVSEIVKMSQRGGEISKKDFMEAAARYQKYTQLTPLEIELIFWFARTEKEGTVSLENFQRMFDPSWEDYYTRYRYHEERKIKAAKNATRNPRMFFYEVFENVYNFALGSVAGAFGATVVYPIDLVKTRMQNQRKVLHTDTLFYKNSWDCFKKVIANEGVRGLYSGLLPQLVGVAPEKAIKLTVNDLVRGLLADDKGNIKLWAEIVAGGMAGSCQVIFTNPLEIVKIRLQVQGEQGAAEGVAKRSALSLVRQLGFFGLYKGASACLLRDLPFSAIYFPAYAHLKKDYYGEGPGHRLNIWQLLVSGAVAGIPAAYLTTPCDVIKTRLQVEARAGQTSYHGLRHAAKTIWKEEGFRAFFKGGVARILRSSPQFGCTLAAYEVLHRILPYPGHGDDSTEAGHYVSSAASTRNPPMTFLRSRNSLKVLLDIDENFGKPRFNVESLKKVERPTH